MLLFYSKKLQFSIAFLFVGFLQRLPRLWQVLLSPSSPVRTHKSRARFLVLFPDSRAMESVV